MILHVASQDEWLACENATHYFPASFDNEGFIHCCLERQLDGVLDRYFKNKNDLWLMKIDDLKLTCSVVFEEGPDKDLFPHIYGAVPKVAIVDVKKIR